METPIIKLGKKQIFTLNLLDDPTIVDLLYGGGAGGMKSWTICLWSIFQCRNYPGIRIGLGRKEISRLKQTTLITLLREVHPKLGIKEADYKYNDHSNNITYVNSSSILLVDLAPEPSDPNFDKFGSLNLTHTIIEEIGEVEQKARDIFTSRKNRYLNKEYGIVGKSIATCNPSQNFVKAEYYKPYKNLGGGEFQKWEYGNVFVKGVEQPAYRAFIRSLVTDNPFIDRNYIESLRRLPETERKRLLEGNWDFEDSDKMVFKPLMLERALTDFADVGTKYIGVDIADTGSDKTILSLVENKVIIEQRSITVDKTEAIGEQIAMEIIKYAQQNGMDSRNAKQIGIDANGVGASTRDFLRSKGWYVKEFLAGAKSELPNFRNIRGEVIWSMSEEMDKGNYKVHKNLSTWETLREQLLAHEYTTEERVILITPKKELKKKLGVSPDYAESFYIAFWTEFSNNDPRNNTNRIAF
jgi:hypothetical protein